MVLLEVGLEGRGAGVGGLVTESSAGASHEVVVILGDAGLALLHAPEDEGNATEEEGTANTANDTADDLLVALAKTSAVVGRALRLRGFGHGCLAGGINIGAGACGGNLGSLAVDDSAVDGGVELDGGGDEGCGADDGGGPEGRRWGCCCA